MIARPIGVVIVCSNYDVTHGENEQEWQSFPQREIQIENDWARVCFWTFLQFSHVTSLSGNWEAKNSANSFIRFLLLCFP